MISNQQKRTNPRDARDVFLEKFTVDFVLFSIFGAMQRYNPVLFFNVAKEWIKSVYKYYIGRFNLRSSVS